MYEEKELLNLLIEKIEYQIKINKDNLKAAKQDTKKLIKSKDDLIETGIDDYVFDDKIKYLHDVREKLNNRIYVLKKIKYRLDVAKRMLEELN